MDENKAARTKREKESKNEDGRDVYFRVGEELVELKGLSDEDMKRFHFELDLMGLLTKNSSSPDS